MNSNILPTPGVFLSIILLLAAVSHAQEPDTKVQACPIEQPFDLEAAFADARPPLAEARWTLVPWRTSLSDALAEAERRDKPVFLYVNDGEIWSGKC